MKDPIVYAGVSEKEKVLKALALTFESGFASALKSLIKKTPHSALLRIEKTGLQNVMKSSPMAACALEIHYHTGLEGNALLVCRSGDLVNLGALLSGAEAIIGDTLSPDLMGVCVDFFKEVVAQSNKLFSAQRVPIASDDPELINPDGKAAGLEPLSVSYDGVACAMFEAIVEPKLNCRYYLLSDSQLLDSLMLQLPDYDPNPPVMSAAQQRLAAKKQNPEESFTYVPVETDADASRLQKAKLEKPGNWNIELILDVELPVAVSFGNCQMPLRDVLKLAAGSVIELDKSVNDPVTVIVNRKPVARGEVVMVDGNYGVRITEVESTAERIRSLGPAAE